MLFHICLKKEGGKIINTALLSSEVAFQGFPAYIASKGGVRQLTKAMAVEFAKEKIQVNAIDPGYYKTALTSATFSDEKRAKWIDSRTEIARRFGWHSCFFRFICL